MGQKAAFPKAILDRSGCSKQVFFGLLEHMVTRFWTIENPKCLENGLSGDQKWVKIGSKLHFSKSDCGPFGMPEQNFLAHFELMVTRFWPMATPKMP